VAPAPTASGTIPIVIGGVLYQAVFSDVAGSAQVPSSRIIAAGTGLTGGGNLTQDRVIAVANGGIGDTQLDNSGVVAGTYGSSTQIPVIQVNAKGRVIGVTLTAPSFAGLVPDSRQIIAGTGLSGGGDLQANRTLSINFSNATPQALGSASPGVGTQAARDDHVHPPVDLSDASERTGILGIANGGTGENITNLVAGAVLFTDGTHLVLQTTQGTPGQVLTSDGANAPYWATVTGTGTVTSVGLAMPSIFNVTGSPITIAGTLTASLANQNANVVFAGPTNGAAAAPTFRALVNADVPTTLTGKTISGSDNTLSNIGNSSLTNSSLTIGTTNIALGATSLTLGGLTSIDLTQDPTTALQVATKQYVDNVAEGLDVKASCIAATTGDITLSGAQTIDGVSVVAGNRVLVKNQSAAEENGIYIADNATWFRSSDANTWDELRSAFTFIEQGTTNGDTGWVCTINAGGTLGVTAVTWSQFSGAGTYTAGTGLTLTGSVFSLTSPVTTTLGGTGLTSYTAGDLPYYASGTALNKLAIGSSTYLLSSSGTAPQWSDPAGVTVGAATNVAGGAANQIVYNTGAGATSFLTAPTVANTFLEWSGSAFQWSVNPLGDVVGPASAVDTQIARFDGTTGKLIDAASVTISDAGAVQNINELNFDVTPTSVAGGQGSLSWNSSEGTLDLVMKGGNVTQHIGEEFFYTARNATGSTINKAVPVYASGVTVGSNRIEVTPMIADGSIDELRYIGMTAESISTGVNGLVTEVGYLRNINASGSPYGQTWAAGDIIYVSATAAGGLTNVQPVAPNLKIVVALVINPDNNFGVLLVRPTVYSQINDLSNVNISMVTGGDVLVYDGTDARWENAAQSTITAGKATNIDGGTAGAVPYQTGAGATTFLALGTSGQVITAGASAPEYTNQSSLSVGTATNLAAGVAGAVPYQTGAGATGFSAAGNSGEFLVSGGTGAPTWTATISGGTFA
jgi:hypothetical protein